MSTEAAKNLIIKDSLITNANLLELVDGSETSLHTHGGGGGDGNVADGGGKIMFGWDYDSSTQGTWATTINTSAVYNAVFNNNSSNNDGDNVHFSIYLTAGTYSLKMMGITDTNKGVSDIYIDDAEVASFDWYNGTTVRNVVKTATGIVVAASGVKDIKVIIDGKNGSSSDHRLVFSSLLFYRTA